MTDLINITPPTPLVITITPPTSLAPINVHPGPSVLNVISHSFLYERLTITVGQTIFSLNATPLTPSLTWLVLNGVKTLFGSDYIIDRDLVSWISTLSLEVGDLLEIYY